MSISPVLLKVLEPSCRGIILHTNSPNHTHTLDPKVVLEHLQKCKCITIDKILNNINLLEVCPEQSCNMMKDGCHPSITFVSSLISSSSRFEHYDGVSYVKQVKPLFPIDMCRENLIFLFDIPNTYDYIKSFSIYPQDDTLINITKIEIIKDSNVVFEYDMPLVYEWYTLNLMFAGYSRTKVRMHFVNLASDISILLRNVRLRNDVRDLIEHKLIHFDTKAMSLSL